MLQTILITCIFLSVLDVLPQARLLARTSRGGLALPVVLLSLLCHLTLLVGSILGLLRVDLARWIVIVSLTVISVGASLPFVFHPMGRSGLSFYYYFNFGSSVVWTMAFSVVAIVALVRPMEPRLS